MIEIPKRASLIDQVASILRSNLRVPEWADSLPPERALSDLLQVSRPTLRLALDILRREGWVRLSENRRCWIPVRMKRTLPLTEPKSVALLTPELFQELSHSHIFHLYQLRRHLQDAGVRLEVVADLRLKRRSPAKILERHLHRITASCWILHHSTAQAQDWFWDRRLPAIVMGTCHAGIQFPSIDWDYRAICRHAVGLFLSHGHQRIALIGPRSKRAGDLLREQSFREAVQPVREAEAQPLVVQHDGSIEHIHRQVRALFRSPTPPTALLVSESVHVLNILTLLTHLGIRVPQDVSLISCDQEWFLSHVTPTIACYQTDWNAYAQRLARIAVQLTRTGVLARRSFRLIPPFQNGESLAMRK
ncbi:MAG: LacI family DNA-binding transcriptional regulator [Verrucomicrobia bacterium]|nr:LacI family DNA-binding transcriptional regulator [Verrucomicrobiota bacterium]